MNFNYQMIFSKTGRARFIAHLDTLSCLMRAIRRAGFEFAYTQGMRPKPILSLAMPLGVGVEGESEIFDFSLQQRAPIAELAKKLSGELPEGINLISIGPSFDRTKSASRVESVSYRIELAEPLESYEEAADSYNQAAVMVLTRHRPKGDKEVDIKKYVDKVGLLESGGGIFFDMKVTPEGTGRPDEIIEALTRFAGGDLRATRVTRTKIRLQEEEQPRPSRYRGQRPGRGRQ